MGWVVFGLILITIAAMIGTVVGGVMGESFIGAIVGAVFGGMVGLLVAMVPITYGQAHYNERSLTCRVEDKDRGGNSDGMRVYTSCGTFQNTDSWWRGKFDSGDVWADITFWK